MVNHGEIKEQDLINDHKGLVKTWIKTNTDWELDVRKKILKLYDENINKHNIRYYMNREIKIFVFYLIHGKVKKAAKYFPKGYLDHDLTH